MKNSLKGSVLVYLLLIVIAVLAVTLGYVYINKSTPASSDQAVTSDTVLEPNTAVSNIRVVSPNGGENIKIGDTYKISWTSSVSDPSTFSIFLVNGSIHCLKGSVGCWTDYGIIGGLKNSGSYMWNTNAKMFGDAGPNSVSVVPGSQYKIKICKDSTTICDTSDNYFTISSDKAVLTQGIIGTVNATGCGTVPVGGMCNDRPEHLANVPVSIKAIDAVDANGNPVSTHVVATVTTDQYGNFQTQLNTGNYIACSNSNCTNTVAVKQGVMTSIIISVPRL